MDWSEIELKVFSSEGDKSNGYVCLPKNNTLTKVSAIKQGKTWSVIENDLNTKLKISK